VKTYQSIFSHSGGLFKYMKKILLLGDSIRQNYENHVKEKLQGKADVRFHNDNGRFCLYTLRYLHQWIDELYSPEERNIDIIHFNNGLWDVLRLTGDNDNLTPSDIYASFLKRIVYMLRYLCPGAVILFALTTPVIEPGFAPGPDYGIRINADIIKYNNIAKDALSPLGVRFNDLWSVVKNAQKDIYSDDVHFKTELGIQTLGNAVIASIMPFL
jgi:hypothetical protein